MNKDRITNIRGFSLIELMVVITIIGLIGGMVAVNVFKQFGKAKEKTTAVEIRRIEEALGHYYLVNGNYPTLDRGLGALAEGGEYLKKVPKDPWKQEYVYISPGQDGRPYDIFSKGPDQQEGTEDDITSWEEEE